MGKRLHFDQLKFVGSGQTMPWNRQSTEQLMQSITSDKRAFFLKRSKKRK